MKTRLLAAGMVALGLLAVACSKSSTGPSDPLLGTWKLQISGVVPTQAFVPDPITITVSTSGSTYTATYSSFTWSYTSPVSVIDTWSPSTFAIKGDSMLIVAHDNSAPACYFTLGGVISGTTASGVSGVSGQMCTPGSWPWTATKQ